LLFLLQKDYETTQDKRLLNRTVDELLRMQEIYLSLLMDIYRREDGTSSQKERAGELTSSMAGVVDIVEGRG
jgi:hypothetical protein